MDFLGTLLCESSHIMAYAHDINILAPLREGTNEILVKPDEVAKEVGRKISEEKAEIGAQT